MSLSENIFGVACLWFELWSWRFCVNFSSDEDDFHATAIHFEEAEKWKEKSA